MMPGLYAPPLLFLRPTLEALSRGRVIRKTMFYVLWLKAIAVVLIGIAAFVAAIISATSTHGAAAVLAGIVAGLLLLVCGAGVAQVLIYRARCILDLEDSNYTVIPISEILMRTAGEAGAVAGVVCAVGGSIIIWVTGGMGPLASILPHALSAVGGGVLAGFGWLVGLGVLSYIWLVTWYLLAESTIVIVDIAENIHHIRADGRLRTGDGRDLLAPPPFPEA